MARPERHDVDYFPFYVKDGKTLFILEGKYGCKGTGFFTNVMRFLCCQPDHYFCIKDDSDRLYFFAKVKCDEESGLEMLDIMAKTCKIHTSLWVSCKVIVSLDLLQSIKDAYRNRINDIITISEIEEKFISDVGNSQDVGFLTLETHKDGDNPPLSDIGNPQSKVKESKVNIYSPIFDCWNASKIVGHRKLTDKMKTAINSALSEFSSDEILKAIGNYSEILSSPEYYFKYRWTLEDFLKRGLRKFVDSVDPKNNFKKNNATQGTEDELLKEFD